MWGAILAARFFVSWYRRNFGSSNLNCFSSYCLSIWVFKDEVLGIDPIRTKCTFFFPTLDGSASILWPKESMNFLPSVLSTIKMVSSFPLLRSTRLAVSKLDPAVIGSSRKICEMLPSLYPSILYHHILPLSRLRKSSENALRTLWHPGYGEKTFVCVPL